LSHDDLQIDRRSFIPLLGASAAFLMLARNASAQQFAISKTSAEVPAPPPGTAMTKAYVQSAGRMAYLWGWPLVANRAISFSKAPEPGLLGGILPVAFGRNAMLTEYVSPEQTFVTCPNQDVVYGSGYFIATQALALPGPFCQHRRARLGPILILLMCGA
jgi:hypothetical protein